MISVDIADGEEKRKFGSILANTILAGGSVCVVTGKGNTHPR